MGNTVTLGEIFAKANDCFTPSFNSVQFESDVDNLSKAETENLLGTIQAEILKGGDYDMLTEMRSIALDHLNDIVKGYSLKHQVGETKQFNGKTFVWTEYSPGKFDWRPTKNAKQNSGDANKKMNVAHKVPNSREEKEEVRKWYEQKMKGAYKVPNREEVRKFLENNAPDGTNITDEMIDKVINNAKNRNKK